MVKDMFFYRDKINQLIEAAFKNNIQLEINKNPLMVVEIDTNSRVKVKNSKFLTKDTTVIFMGEMLKNPRID